MVSAVSPPKSRSRELEIPRSVSSQSGPNGVNANKAAIALGAAYGKVYYEGRFYCVRSLVTEEVTAELVASEAQLKVQIRNSEIACHRAFAVGENLEKSADLQSIKDGLKGEWYAPLSVGILAFLAAEHEASERVDMTLACSLPTVNLRHDVACLKGRHEVSVNGKPPVEINIQSLILVPEGLGTAVYLAREAPVAVVDFGFQNTTVAAYDPRSQRMIGQESLKGGVSLLFEKISSLANTTGEPPSLEEIRLGVEAGTFELNGYSRIRFKDAYDKAFNPWVQARIHQARTQAGYLFGKCPVKVFAGGGSQLPGMQAISKSAGVEICESPQKAEVQGIYRFIGR